MRYLPLLILLSLIACTGTFPGKPAHLFPIKEFGRYGYIDSTGHQVIACRFEWAGDFSEGLAPILQDSLYGFINTAGKIVIAPKFSHAEDFSDGLCAVTLAGDTVAHTQFIRPDGSTAFIVPISVAGAFHNGRAQVTIGNSVCYLNKRGKVVINTHFPYGSGRFRDGIAMVWSGDKSQYIDTTGSVIATFPSMGNDEFSEGLARVQIGDTAHYIDVTGKVRMTPQDAKLNYSSFSSGLAQAFLAGYDHKTGFIDTSGALVIPVVYSNVRNFTEGLAAFWQGKQWGFIDHKGQVSIKPQFDDVEWDGFQHGLCKAGASHKWGYINHQGHFVWKEQDNVLYHKLDPAQWKLDTLQIQQPLADHMASNNANFPRQTTQAPAPGFTLRIDTVETTVFTDKYWARKVYLTNGSPDTVTIPAQDGRIKLIQQAVNKKGKWQDIERFTNSMCGNSYHTLFLVPGEFQLFAAPLYKGGFRTKLRFRLALANQEIYSNTYTGRINAGQFANPADKYSGGIVVESASRNR
jgi:hypothetical protein